jgi:hypothetical protein
MPLNNTRHSPEIQRRLDRDHGEYISHYPVIKCSCQADGEHPKPTCKVCGGSGRVYGRMKRQKGLIGGITAQDKALLVAGIAMPGDLIFSPALGARTVLHDYDMVRLAYGLPHDGDLLTRGNDRLLYLPTAIIAVERHNPFTGLTTSYLPGIHFTVSGRAITWAPDYGPAHGELYSVRYDALFDWVVYPGVTLPRIKRGHYLGQRVLLRKRHLAGIAALIPADLDPDVAYLRDGDGNLLEGTP